MKNFLRKLVCSNTPESSKRFAALISLLVIVIVTLAATFKTDDWQIPRFMYDGLIIIITGGLGLTAIEKIFGSKDPEPPKEEQN